jgi:hypothetical protein
MSCWIVRGRSYILFLASDVLASSFEAQSSWKKLRQLNFDELFSRRDQMISYGESVSFLLFSHISQSTARRKFRLGIDTRSLQGTLLQVGGLTCRWQRHSVKPSCWECSTIVEQAETHLRVVVPTEEEEVSKERCQANLILARFGLIWSPLFKEIK